MATVYRQKDRLNCTVKVTIGGVIYRLRGNRDKASSRALGERIEKLASIVAQGEKIDQDMRTWIQNQEPRIRDWLVEHDILPRTDEGRRVSLDTLIDEYVTGMEAHGCDEMHAYSTGKRLKKLKAECGWRLASDVTQTALDSWIASNKSKAAKTLKDYHSTLRAFMTWCVDVRRVLWENQISPVRKGDYVGAKKRKRRALTLAEVDRLLASCSEKRRVCYLAVIYCQLRRADAEALTWGDVRLDLLTPYLVTRAESSKGKRDTKHPLRRDLADALRAYKPEGASDADPVFPRPTLPTMEQYKADLARAEIEYEINERRADFHALGRHTPNTIMANAGVPVRVAQQLMRHTDPALTAGAYTDSELLETSQAVEMMPALGQGEHLKESAILKMEGTTDRPIDTEVDLRDLRRDHDHRIEKPHATSDGNPVGCENQGDGADDELVTCGAGNVCDGDDADWQGDAGARGNGPENWAARTRT